MTIIACIKTAGGIALISDMLLSKKGEGATISIPTVGRIDLWEEKQNIRLGFHATRMVRKPYYVQHFGMLAWAGGISGGQKLRDYLIHKTQEPKQYDVELFNTAIGELSIEQQSELSAIYIDENTLQVHAYRCTEFKIEGTTYWLGGSGADELQKYIEDTAKYFQEFHLREGIPATPQQIGMSLCARLIFRETLIYPSRQSITNRENPRLLEHGCGGFYEAYFIEHAGKEFRISNSPAALYIHLNFNGEGMVADVTRLYCYKRINWGGQSTALIFSFINTPCHVQSGRNISITTQQCDLYVCRPFNPDGKHEHITLDPYLISTLPEEQRIFMISLQAKLVMVSCFADVKITYDDVANLDLNYQLDLIDQNALAPWGMQLAVESPHDSPIQIIYQDKIGYQILIEDDWINGLHRQEIPHRV